MKIDFEGKTWRFEEDEITVAQAEQIEAEGPWKWVERPGPGEPGEPQPRSGHSLFDWRRAIAEGSPHAYRVLYWLMRAQDGEPIPLGQADCAFLKLIAAFGQAWAAEMKAVAEAEGEPDPTQPPVTPPTPAGQPPEPPPSAPATASSPARSNGS